MATADSKFSSIPFLLAGVASVLAVMPIVYFEYIQSVENTKHSASQNDYPAAHNTQALISRRELSGANRLGTDIDQLPPQANMDWAITPSDMGMPAWMTEGELSKFEEKYTFENKYKNEIEQSVSAMSNQVTHAELLDSTQTIENTKVKKQPRWAQQDLRVAKEAHTLFQQHRAPEAQARLREFIGQYPKSIWSRICYIKFLFKQQLWDTAYQQIIIALNATNQDRAFVKLLARWYVKRRAFTAAYQVLDQYNPVVMADTAPRHLSVTAVIDPEFIALQAALSQQTKQFEKAVYLYETLIEVQPDQFDYWLGLAAALDAMKQKQKAYYVYTSALNMVSSSDHRVKVIERNQHLWRYAAMRRYKLKQDIRSNMN